MGWKEKHPSTCGRMINLQRQPSWARGSVHQPPCFPHTPFSVGDLFRPPFSPASSVLPDVSPSGLEVITATVAGTSILKKDCPCLCSDQKWSLQPIKHGLQIHNVGPCLAICLLAAERRRCVETHHPTAQSPLGRAGEWRG